MASGSAGRHRYLWYALLRFAIITYIRLRMMVSITNTPATHLVASVSRESRDFDLFFEKYVSVLPLSAPESPELFPDWSTIMQMSVMQQRRCMMRNAVFTKSMV